MQKLPLSGALSGLYEKWSSVLITVLLAVLCWFCLVQLGLLSLIPYIGKRAETIIYAIVVGFLLGLTSWRGAVTVGACGVLVLWLLVCFSPLTRWLVSPLLVHSTPRKLTTQVATREADAVVVLASGIQADNDFSDVSLARFLGGLEAVRTNRAPLMVLTEAAPPAGSHQEAANRLLTSLKIECPILAVGPVHDTHDEAVAVANLAREEGWKTIILVTSPTHSLRSEMVFRQAGRDFGLNVVPRPCRETAYDLENLYWPKDRLQAFSSAIHELIGISIYRRRGWIA
jgi:uncharacterized SAM-binding protein YcdF (DUF218 family)